MIKYYKYEIILDPSCKFVDLQKAKWTQKFKKKTYKKNNVKINH